MLKSNLSEQGEVLGTLKVCGLFAGIGGFELGMANAGFDTSMLVEILPQARAVLKDHFLDARIVSDIRSLKQLPQEVDLVCAGFPCQDLSQAGTTRGLRGKNSGIVWELFRLLEKRQVPWLILENVPFMLRLGGGHAMLQIVERLEGLGFQWAWRVVDTFSFGLPQRRERVLLVASTVGDPPEVLLADDAPINRPQTDLERYAHGFYWTEGRTGLGWAVNAVPTLKNGSTIGIPSPPAILLPNGNLVKPDLRDAERLQGFPKDWTFPAEHVAKGNARWSLVGNAVSVPVAEWIAGRLTKPGFYDRSRDRTFPMNGRLPVAARGDRKKRYSVEISTDPIGKPPTSLAKFLCWPGTPLSARATAGFLGRARSSNLRFAEGFLERVEEHYSQIVGRALVS